MPTSRADGARPQAATPLGAAEPAQGSSPDERWLAAGAGPDRRASVGPPHRSDRTRHRVRVDRVLAVLAAVVTLAVMAPGATIARAISAPGTDSVSARLAEWARDHHMGALVTWLEEAQYRASPPTKGGRPDLGTYGLAGPPAAGCRACRSA